MPSTSKTWFPSKATILPERFHGVKYQVFPKPVLFVNSIKSILPKDFNISVLPILCKGSNFKDRFSFLFQLQLQLQFQIQLKIPARQLATSLKRYTIPFFNARPQR